MRIWRWIESVLLLLPVRLALAGLFGMAAVLKLNDPQAFAFSIKAYEVFDPSTQGHAIVLLAFVIPWTELLVALCLLLGLWTRAAAVLLVLMLIAFTAGLLHVITNNIDIECACFGDYQLVCEGPAGWCNIARNAVLLLASALLVWRGGGLLALDTAIGRGGPPRTNPDGVDRPADTA